MFLAAVTFIIGIHNASAQSATPVTRQEAIASAVARGSRLMLARADTAAVLAQLHSARALQNPLLAASYTKSTPNYHATLELPFDLPHQRSARVGAARAARVASQYRFTFERAAVALDADTTYTRALAARELAQLSRRNALAADSLRRIAAARREAGDVSDLEVELAAVSAGQAANVAAADSLTYLSATLDLQSVMGLAADWVAIVPVDSLGDPAITSSDSTSVRTTLQVAAAQASLESARLGLRLQRRSIFGQPALLAGIETGDPGGAETGILPTFGFSIPLPLLNLNRGGIATAQSEVARAQAELTLAEVQSRTEITRARRELAVGYGKIERDRLLVGAAERVSRMSLTAYREGASTLATVLEAQRNAREVLAQYVNDLADVWIVAAELRVVTLTSEQQ